MVRLRLLPAQYRQTGELHFHLRLYAVRRYALLPSVHGKHAGVRFRRKEGGSARRVRFPLGRKGDGGTETGYGGGLYAGLPDPRLVPGLDGERKERGGRGYGEGRLSLSFPHLAGRGQAGAGFPDDRPRDGSGYQGERGHRQSGRDQRPCRLLHGRGGQRKGPASVRPSGRGGIRGGKERYPGRARGEAFCGRLQTETDAGGTFRGALPCA